MHWYTKLRAYIRKGWLLMALLALAFLLRVVGIGYGLPLTVVNDEYPFTYAALQMIQSHTLIPALHPDAFVHILPYPPYLSYMLLLPFAAILGIKFLLWQGSTALLQAYLVSDLSAFFMTARLVNVLLGILSVYLIYRISETLFKSRVAAGAAGFLVATSLLHEALSMVGRNWMPMSFVFLLILFILTRDGWGLKRRYTIGLAIGGLGMGITSLSALSVALIALYYVTFDAKSLMDVMHDARRLVPAAFLFIVLAAIPSILWHSGNAFLNDVTLTQVKSIFGLLESPWTALSLIMYAEPVLIMFCIGGIAFLFALHRRAGIFIAGWFLLYIAAFYVLFRFEPRFLVPLVPLFALAGGYCVARIWNHRSAMLLCVVLCIPLIAAVRLSYLAAQGDTRQHAREWVLEQLTPRDTVLVFSSGVHIPTQAAAVADLRSIDEGALRKVDEADQTLDRHDVPYVLNNLTSITGTTSIHAFTKYVKRHGYEYLVLEPRSLPGLPAMASALAPVMKHAEVVQQFEGLGDTMSLYNSAFTEFLPVLFSHTLLGPDIVIYKIQ